MTINSTSIICVKIRLKDIYIFFFCTCDWCTMYYMYPLYTRTFTPAKKHLDHTHHSAVVSLPLQTSGDGLTKEPMQAEDVLSLGSAFERLRFG